VKDCPNIRNIPKIFLRSFENVALVLGTIIGVAADRSSRRPVGTSWRIWEIGRRKTMQRLESMCTLEQHRFSISNSVRQGSILSPDLFARCIRYAVYCMLYASRKSRL